MRVQKEPEDLLEVPAYSPVEAARYLRVPLQTLRYWCFGRETTPPLVSVPSTNPPRLSYFNLLECHMLSAMRSIYNVRLPKVRRALRHLARHRPSRHPLVYQAFETNRVDLFTREYNALINLSQDGQLAIEEMLKVHLQRIEPNQKGLFKFFPFVQRRSADEPKVILIDPTVRFGRPVIAGTGISTAFIAARFDARESVGALAEEYGRSAQEIEEAVRWEKNTSLAA